MDEALLLRFKSDDTINSKGFSASFSVIDDGTGNHAAHTTHRGSLNHGSADHESVDHEYEDKEEYDDDGEYDLVDDVVDHHVVTPPTPVGGKKRKPKAVGVAGARARHAWETGIQLEEDPLRM